MAFGKTITFFSDMTGRLVDASGAPQPGVEVVRTWKRSPEDTPSVDRTHTDANGLFRFAAATGTSVMASFLPGTPVIKQEVTAAGPHGSVTLWKAVKTNFDPNGELGGRRLDLVCRIDAEPDGNGPAWGTCREASAD